MGLMGLIVEWKIIIRIVYMSKLKMVLWNMSIFLLFIYMSESVNIKTILPFLKNEQLPYKEFTKKKERKK